MKRVISNISLAIVILCIIFISGISIIKNFDSFKENTESQLYLILFITFLYPAYLGIKWVFSKIEKKKILIIPIWLILILLSAIVYYFSRSFIILFSTMGVGLIFNAICWMLKNERLTTTDKNTSSTTLELIERDNNIEEKLSKLNNCISFSKGALSKFIHGKIFSTEDYIEWYYIGNKRNKINENDEIVPNILELVVFSLSIIDPMHIDTFKKQKDIAEYIASRIRIPTQKKNYEIDTATISRAKKIVKEKDLLNIDKLIEHFEQ